ncbi:hypothetical protein WH47_12746 [Habropoda laboriosa]|uniref:Uncharacterized protein n=1 Tax=Habropoda laboriosa TaxID=597456 RepID=A0A0L7R4Z1_9HYME|nr:hypothetical protein WH47_12746 [Habropoda laboriosa]
MLEIVEIDHGQTCGEQFHETVPEQFPRHVRISDVSGLVSGHGTTRDSEQVFDDARLRSAMQKDQQIDKIQELGDVCETIEKEG